tara:strand:+ start:131 stop:565 length:435 start_codon:yes stop_codon:yes gene_type:complete
MTTFSRKPNVLFWVISILAFLWNIMGVLNYLAQAFMTPESLALLSKEEQVMFPEVPAYVTAAFAIAVFGGVLGSLLLLMRKKLSKILFVISFLGIAVQMTYGFMTAENYDSYGPGGIYMPIFIIVLGAFLIWYSGKAHSNGWLT